ncbi:PREDICTED: aluminum-activated malate transporter 8 [Fragaria vesca subsp. vesca]|uniref:aluminum-activated malate transporter 8 n=1 Tax=Fragaria vesca subsp. vesca TaxID=101020 RepID=UPI0002C3644C|nr:PREDICTED: aluminum-activated malate transporter 8 [Fragaria vesca subsp. vesca]
MEIINDQLARGEHPKAGVFERAWSWVKALPGNFKNKVTKVAKNTIKLGKDDPRRVIHSLKVAMALTLVSLLYYWRALYDGLGVAGMWAVLTVVVVFEFTVGATLSKGLNRSFATLLAGALGIGANHLASLFGEQGEPIILGVLVFLLAAASTFSRFFPRIKERYDYGVLIFILTFSMVTVSGYRVEGLLQMAYQRLITILIGGGTCIILSIFLCPVWAGEDLHSLIASNIDKIANYLEGIGGGEYFQLPKDGKSTKVTQNNGYKSVLNSKNTEESWANFARWEPGHGRFKFRHPWKQYLKTGALVRQCAYQIETLNSHINSDVQVPQEFLQIIQASCITMSTESGKALKALGTAIKTMKDPKSACQHLENSKNAVEELHIALKAASLEDADILAIIPAATIASILVEIVTCVEKISMSVYELSQLADFKVVEATVSPEIKPQLLHKGSINPILLDDGDYNPHVVIRVDEIDMGSHQEDDKISRQTPKGPKQIEEV